MVHWQTLVKHVREYACGRVSMLSTAVLSLPAEHTAGSTSLPSVPSTLAPNGPVLLIESVSCH